MSQTTRLLALFTALAGGAAGFAPTADAQPGGAPPPPEVEVIAVTPGDVPVALEYVGVLEASRTVEVRSRVRGFLDERHFEEGAAIEAGTQLFTIDPRSFRADLQIAIAQVEQAEARLKLARQEVERLQSVKVPGAIAESDLDRQIAEEVNAQAALRLAEAQRAKAELELGYTTIEAPLTGFIGKTLKEIGSYVDDGQNSLLAVMHQVDPIYASFQMSERDYLRWQEALADGTLVLPQGTEPAVSITLRDGTVAEGRGLINFQSPDVSLRTGSVEFRATFENSDARLKPGQFATVRLLGYVQAGAIAIPQRAVSQSPQGTYVFVIDDDNKAELRTVTPGPWANTDWIVERGLKPGDRVVVEGLIKVQPGVEVVPVPYQAAEASASSE